MIDNEINGYTIHINELVHNDLFDKLASLAMNPLDSLNNKLMQILIIAPYKGDVVTLYAYGRNRAEYYGKDYVLTVLLEHKKINGNYVRIEHVDANSPREYQDLTVLELYHRRYDLCNESKHTTDDFSSWSDLNNLINKENKIAVILAVHMYDHSGTAFSTTPFDCKFDSGTVGFIYITKEKVQELYGKKNLTKNLIEKATDFLNAEIKEYTSWCNGETYTYSVYNNKFEQKEELYADCIYGFSELQNYLKEAHDICIDYTDCKN